MRIDDQLNFLSNDGPGRLRLVGAGEENLNVHFESLSFNSRNALHAVDDVSRRIDDLARKLGCLGHFDQSDGPRAA